MSPDNGQEGSPRGAGNQIEEAEDKGYNPLVPGRVVYIYRWLSWKHILTSQRCQFFGANVQPLCFDLLVSQVKDDQFCWHMAA